MPLDTGHTREYRFQAPPRRFDQLQLAGNLSYGERAVGLWCCYEAKLFLYAVSAWPVRYSGNQLRIVVAGKPEEYVIKLATKKS